jgi:glycosyltransferase involved in cell wall biosynthesis
VFNEQRNFYPQFRFISQANAGPGAARNRGLAEATGEYFITVDADNVCLPHMVSTFVRALSGRPELSACTCFLVGFRRTEDIARREFCFEYCPSGGPHVMASFDNVYGDTNAIFRAVDLRSVGGYETDRSTPWEDWETFVKMVNRGYRIDVVPEMLLYYRVRDDSRLREMTDGWAQLYRPNLHLLRNCFFPIERLPESEQAALWTSLVSFQKRAEQLNRHIDGLHRQLGREHESAVQLQQHVEHYHRHIHDLEHHLRHYLEHINNLQNYHERDQQQIEQLQAMNQDLQAAMHVMRYRLVDKLNARMKRVPLVQRTVKGSIYLTWKAWRAARLGPVKLVRKLVRGNAA